MLTCFVGLDCPVGAGGLAFFCFFDPLLVTDVHVTLLVLQERDGCHAVPEPQSD